MKRLRGRPGAVPGLLAVLLIAASIAAAVTGLSVAPKAALLTLGVLNVVAVAAILILIDRRTRRLHRLERDLGLRLKEYGNRSAADVRTILRAIDSRKSEHVTMLRQLERLDSAHTGRRNESAPAPSTTHESWLAMIGELLIVISDQVEELQGQLRPTELSGREDGVRTQL